MTLKDIVEKANELAAIGNERDKVTLEVALRMYEAVPEPWVDVLGKESATKAYNERGLTLAELDRHDLAVIDFDKGIECDPLDGVLYLNRGVSKAELGKFEEALQDYDKAAELMPKCKVAFIRRGECKLDLARLDDAVLDFDEAIKLDPKDSRSYSKRGLCKLKMLRFEDAIGDYEKVLKNNPDNAIVQTALAVCKMHLGNYTEAIADYDKAIELGVRNAFIYHSRAFAKHKLGAHQEALQDLEEALRIDPVCVHSYALVGDVCRALDRNSEAEAHYQIALGMMDDKLLRVAVRAERGLKALGKEVTTNYTAIVLEKGLLSPKEIEEL